MTSYINYSFMRGVLFTRHFIVSRIGMVRVETPVAELLFRAFKGGTSRKEPSGPILKEVINQTQNNRTDSDYLMSYSGLSNTPSAIFLPAISKSTILLSRRFKEVTAVAE